MQQCYTFPEARFYEGYVTLTQLPVRLYLQDMFDPYKITLKSNRPMPFV